MNLEKMTFSQLRLYATRLGLSTITKAATKRELIAGIRRMQERYPDRYPDRYPSQDS